MSYFLNGVAVSREEWLTGAPGFTPGCPPVTGATDREFFRGDWEGSQDKATQFYRKQAERQGISTTGKRYMGQLARFPGDPRAFVSGLSDVKRICEEDNLTCNGLVNHKADGRGLEPTAEIGLAQDLVDGEVNEILAKEPEKKRAKVEEDVRTKRTPRWKKGAK